MLHIVNMLDPVSTTSVYLLQTGISRQPCRTRRYSSVHNREAALAQPKQVMGECVAIKLLALDGRNRGQNGYEKSRHGRGVRLGGSKSQTRLSSRNGIKETRLYLTRELIVYTYLPR